jgi:hypothetical protein
MSVVGRRRAVDRMMGRSAKRVMERRRGTTRRTHSMRNWKDLSGGKRERMLEWSAMDDLRRYFGKQGKAEAN